MRDEKIAALQAEIDKKRADLQLEIQEREAALQQVKTQISQREQAEKEAIDKSLRSLVTSYDQSSNRMIETTKAGFAVLEQAGIDTFNGILGELQRRANAFYSSQPTSQALTLSGRTGGSNIPLSAFTGANNIRSFQHGTLGVDRPTLSVIGDVRPGWAEAAIPYPKHTGLAAELARLGISGGGPSVSVSFSGAQIGCSVSQDDLDQLELRVVRGVARGLQGAKTGVMPNA